MLGIIVCKLQPSKATFKMIKEHVLLFVCLLFYLIIFLPRQNKKVRTVTTLQR